MNYATQMDAARKGIITNEMKAVAAYENRDVEDICRWVAEGKVRTPAQKATRARGAIHTLKSLPLRRENQMPETTEGLSTGSAQP